jgi:hypothetical protein
VGGSYGYFLSKYDWREHKFEQAVRWGNMFIEEGDAALQPQMSRFRDEKMADAAIDLRASDILMAGCTPGDIRVHFTAQFIEVASIMGTVHPTKDLLTTQAITVKGGGSSKETYNFGVVHKGALSAEEMLNRELEEGRYA